MESFKFIGKSFGFYFQDKESYEYIEKNISLLQATLTLIIFSFLISLISLSIEYTYSINPYFFADKLVPMILNSVVYIPLFLCFIYVLMYFIFNLFQAKSDLYETIKFGFSISFFPLLLVIILDSIPSRLFSEGLKNIFENSIYPLILILIIVWMFFILIKTYLKLHELSKVKTIIAVIVPYLIIILLGVIIFIFRNNSF